jgi:hypothetical protein
MTVAGPRALGAAALAAVIAAMAPPGPASAQGLTRDEVKSLREELGSLRQRVQELEKRLEDAEKAAAREAPSEVIPPPPPPVAPRRDFMTGELSGQVSAGVLFADNGKDNRFFVADNNNAGSRLGILAQAKRIPWTAGTYFEFGAEVNSTGGISFDQKKTDDNFSIRHAELFFENERYGAVAIGKGDAATNKIAEIDLSGTDVVLGSDVKDLAGGLSYNVGDDEELKVKDVFSNLDGGREARVAYLSPKLAGWSFRASLREDDKGLSPGTALEYETALAGYAFQAGVGYRREQDHGFPGDANTFVGSASTVLGPVGIALAVAAGVEVFDQDNFKEASKVEDNSFVYVKAAYLQQFFVFGETRFAVDYFRGENHGGDERFVVGDVLRTPSTESVGAALVQVVEPLSSELFLGVRDYRVELPKRSAVVLAGASAKPHDLLAVLLGARVRF